MTAEKTPTCESDAQAFLDGMKSVLDCSALDNRAVVVGFLPKHRCCTCHGDELRENKGTRENQDPRGNRHSLEGIWEGNAGDIVICVQTVPEKPGYIFGIKVIGHGSLPIKRMLFCFKTGDGAYKPVLEGKGFYGCEYSLFLGVPM